MDSQKMMASEISAIYFCLLMICMNKWIWHLWRSGVFLLFFLTSTPHKIQFLPCIKKPTWFILYSHTSSQFVLQNRASNSHDRYNNSSKLFFLMTVGGSSFLPSSFWQKRSTFEDRLQRPKLFLFWHYNKVPREEKQMLIFFPISLNRIRFNMLTELDGVNA